jgi:dihydrolipoamide dehydrogenase
MTERADIVIIGGGPGGYLAALRGAQLGKKIVLVEEDRIGGTCINVGCIPTKYLLHQTKIYHEVRRAKTLDGPLAEIRVDWGKVQAGRKAVVDRLVAGLEFLLAKGKVNVLKGTAVLREDGTALVRTEGGESLVAAEKTILAAGSRSADLPFLQPDGRLVVTSTEALEFPEVPKSLLVIGAGAIGLELASVYSRLGTEVTVLEIMANVLPGTDREVSIRLERSLKKQGMRIMTEARIEKAEVGESRVVLRGRGLRTDAPFEVSGEKVLLAAGRKPNTDRLFEGRVFLELDRAGFVKVGPGLEAGRPGMYAIGDIIGGKLLAHKAYHDAVVAAENAAGLRARVDYNSLPTAVFTEPEFAAVGLTEEEAVEKGGLVRTGVFPLQASGRALTMEAAEGLVKVVADGKDRVIGAHLLAPGASELIPVLTMAVAKGLAIRDLASLIYVHPSLSEAVGEAALKAKGEALHILNS